MRNRALLAAICAICCLFWPADGEERTAAALVDAALQGGMSPQALYLRADAVFEGDATSVIGWAKQVAASLPGGEIAIKQDARQTRIAIGAVYPPDGLMAEAGARQLRNALGQQVHIAYCIVGDTDGTDHALSAQNMLFALSDVPIEGMRAERLSSLTGEWAQAAVRADGKAYLGMPLIPMDY